MFKILVCDDQPMMRELMMGAIWAFRPDCHVVDVGNGLEVEQKLALEKFDLVFLDVEMPVQDGFTTLAHVRDRDPAKGAAVVMCTGRLSESDRMRGSELGADYYLTKPIDLDSVGAVLDKFLPLTVAV